MPREKSGSQEVLDSIRSLVSEGKTDLHIASILNKSIKEIYTLRKNVLGITLHSRKRKCEKCEELKATICFKKKSNYPNWCIICRRKYANEKSLNKRGRPVGTKKVKNKKVMTCICLRCNKVFEAEIFIGLGGLEDHFRLCKKCRILIFNMERVSI